MIDISSLKRRYTNAYGCEACPVGTINSIERELGVKLPEDFIEIATFYSGGLLGGMSHHEIANIGVASTVVQETLRLRTAIGLNASFVVLAEPAGSLVVLSVLGEPAVIWCDATDAININSMSFENEADYWDCYARFFSYLLDREQIQ